MKINALIYLKHRTASLLLLNTFKGPILLLFITASLQFHNSNAITVTTNTLLNLNVLWFHLRKSPQRYIALSLDPIWAFTAAKILIAAIRNQRKEKMINKFKQPILNYTYFDMGCLEQIIIYVLLIRSAQKPCIIIYIIMLCKTWTDTTI